MCKFDRHNNINSANVVCPQDIGNRLMEGRIHLSATVVISPETAKKRDICRTDVRVLFLFMIACF